MMMVDFSNKFFFILLSFAVVTVSFSRSSYSFAEGAGTGSYQLTLSNEILQPLTVNVMGGEKEGGRKRKLSLFVVFRPWKSVFNC